ncbi:hypothetical protein R1sor_019872 [Riccia sorocarpa]|uniref:non-specific serine/threonine protein kinase n=1 Tax=Riccia sorocarpa TaxID=122646 RepID=A0ABD3IDQ5_9MARC
MRREKLGILSSIEHTRRYEKVAGVEEDFASGGSVFNSAEENFLWKLPNKKTMGSSSVLSVLLMFLAIIQWLPITSAERMGKSYACGAPKAVTSYGISWESDEAVAPEGSNTSAVGPDYIRYFSAYSDSDPQGNAHCYEKLLDEAFQGSLLLRAKFVYSNYDGLDEPPEFYMWVGTGKLAYINLKKDDPWIEEVIISLAEDRSMQVFCLAAVKGAPVISYIELRPLPADSYSAEGLYLRKQFRIDSGNTNSSLRYPEDGYDRIWDMDGSFAGTSSSVLSSVSLDGEDVPEQPPTAVLNTVRRATGTDLQYSLNVDDTGSFTVKLYTPSGITSDVQVNGVSKATSSVSGTAIRTTTFSGVADSSGVISIVLNENGTQQPQINALEVFEEINAKVSSTDADTMNSLRIYYNDLKLKWIGDPCLPVPWQNLECSSGNQVTTLDLSRQDLVLPFTHDFVSLRSLTLLNLSSNRFSSKLPDLEGLNKLEILDLRHNDFSGTLDALAVLPALTHLYVSFNPRLYGAIPSSLRKSGVSIDIQGTCVGRAANCIITSSPPPVVSEPSKKSNSGVIVGVIAAAVLAIAVLLCFCIILIRRRKKHKAPSGFEEVESDNADFRSWSTARVFTFKELEVATHHFKRQLGEGSFGPVYYGVLANGMKVAIKMRQDTSQLGAEAFANEVYLLSRVHHPNLVPLLGYCQERKNQLLVYEYMPGGTLMDHLYGKLTRINWITRLRIVIGAATGIVYLHNGSDPKIIHRDLKSNNILLDSSMSAKVSDFGLSKLVTNTGATHVTTLVKGTAGYLDPEYFTTNQLTEKSDVYSFGIVLLEIICGREALTGDRAPDEYNLLSWAKPYLVSKNYDPIIDRGLQNNYNPMSVELVASLALRCVQRSGEDRPTMLQVLRELEEALSFEEGFDRSALSSAVSSAASHSALLPSSS